MAGTKRSIEPSSRHERRGRERLNLRGELALAFFPTITILLVLWTLEILADQRVLFAALASSAFLIYLDPLHGTNTMRALSISHAGAALAGIAVAAVLGFGYAASAVAMVLTILLMVVVDAVHSPAIDTSLTFAYRSGSSSNLQLFLIALRMVLLLAALQRVVQYLLSRLARDDGQTMASKRIAILSDVHGNMTAFEAVLADIDARGIRRVFNLGDVFGKGPGGSDAVALSRERCEATVRGNWDELVNVPLEHASPPLRWWLEELTPGDRAWLRDLPFSLDLDLGGAAVRLFHASADSVGHRVHHRHSDDEFHAMFRNTDATGGGPEPDLVVYGDIHSAYEQVLDGKTLLNAGSVGNPLDEPMASYIVLTPDGADVRHEIVRVPYDIEREIALARQRGMPELEPYAIELRTGVYRGLQGRALG